MGPRIAIILSLCMTLLSRVVLGQEKVADGATGRRLIEAGMKPAWVDKD